MIKQPTIPVYLQFDPAWGMKALGNSTQTISAEGCLLCTTAMAEWALGHQITPDALNDLAIAKKAFYGSDLILPNIGLLFSDEKCIAATDIAETDLNADKTGKIPIAQAIMNIQAAKDRGAEVILHVYLGKQPHTGADHFVYLKNANVADWTINDPEYGATTLATPRPGFAGYGKVSDAVYGYRIIEKIDQTIMAPLTVQENTLVMITGVGANGSVGIVFSDAGVPTLHTSDMAKLLFTWFSRNTVNGTFDKAPFVNVSLTQWNAWPIQQLP